MVFLPDGCDWIPELYTAHDHLVVLPSNRHDHLMHQLLSINFIPELKPFVLGYWEGVNIKKIDFLEDMSSKL